MNVLAILCSDIHLSHKPPAARAGEPDWYRAMQRPLDELKSLQERYDCPVICSGDLFDRWNPPPELINFALDELPFMYCIPGQHDLPHHNLDDLHRSAYGTLVKAKRICNVTQSIPIATGLWVQGFPWGTPLQLVEYHSPDDLHVAMIHKYVWTEESGSHPHAEPEGHADAVINELDGFDLIVSGDNHKPFEHGKLFNCGGFMRRSVADTYHPRVGLLMDDMSIDFHYFDVSKDVLEERVEEDIEPIDFSEFMAELNSLNSDSLDFKEAVRIYADSAEVPVQNVLRKVMEDVAD